MKSDLGKLPLLKQDLAEGLRQAERGEFSELSVMEIARKVIAEGSVATEGAADVYMKSRAPLH